MAKISVKEAARRLGVHVVRVHQRIADGSLPAEKIGRDWLIDDVDVSRIGRRRGGRPPSSGSAWNIILVAGDAASCPLPPGKQASAEHWLRELGRWAPEAPEDDVAAELRRLLRHRAERREYHCSPRDLEDLRQDPRVALSGISDPASGIASGDIVEAYASADVLQGVVDEYLLVPAQRSVANVVLHVHDARVSSCVDLGSPNKLLLAADLAEHHGARESARAVQLVRELARETR